MIFQAPDPVPAGQAFDVIAVHGRTPHQLTDFVGEAAFTVRGTDQDRVVTGVGSLAGPTVRFHEKDVDHGGKDVRVWRIGPAESLGQYTAQTDH